MNAQTRHRWRTHACKLHALHVVQNRMQQTPSSLCCSPHHVNGAIVILNKGGLQNKNRYQSVVTALQRDPVSCSMTSPLRLFLRGSHIIYAAKRNCLFCVLRTCCFPFATHTNTHRSCMHEHEHASTTHQNYLIYYSLETVCIQPHRSEKWYVFE